MLRPNFQLVFPLILVSTVGERVCLKIRPTQLKQILWQYLGIWFRANIEWTERLLLSFTSKHQHCRLRIEGGSENTWVCISGTISVEIRWYFIPLSPNLWNKSVFIPSQGHIAMKRAVEWRTMALIYDYNSLPRMMGYIVSIKDK